MKHRKALKSHGFGSFGCIMGSMNLGRLFSDDPNLSAIWVFELVISMGTVVQYFIKFHVLGLPLGGWGFDTPPLVALKSGASYPTMKVTSLNSSAIWG